MRPRLPILLLIFSLIILDTAAFAQNKKKKDKFAQGRPRIMETFGDSIRTDSVVYYETEVGYVMPDHSAKFKGKWDITVMNRQAKAKPDSLVNGLFDFIDDTSFAAFVGCNTLKGTYIIKGPTIKFTVNDKGTEPCHTDTEEWFIRLIQERVSYFGVDDKLLYLKDVAYNIVFNCNRKNER